MGELVWYFLTAIAAGASIGFVICWLICALNLIRLIRLQKVFSGFLEEFSGFLKNPLSNPFSIFSISEAFQGDAFTEVGRKPRMRVMWAAIGFFACWLVGLGAILILG